VPDGLRFRPMEPDELPFVGASWGRSMRPGVRPRDGYLLHGDGRGLAPRHRARAQALLVDELAGHGQCHVAEALDAPGILLGWVCWTPEPLEVHHVFVVPEGRRKGLGTALYRYATGGRSSKHSHTTPDGVGLLRALGCSPTP